MNDQAHGMRRSVREIFGLIFRVLSPESNFYWLAVIYGVGISLLSLATPISVQMLINTVANTGLTVSLVVLSLTLFVLLVLSGLLNALRIHVMDVFQRRLYARLVSEITLKAIYALNPFFPDQSLGALFNRYFDIVIVQKNLPNMLIAGFTIILQTVVGFILVSLYHPLFLLFNLVMIFVIWLIWIIWGGRAMRSAIQVSHTKHAAAAWLESLAESNGFFKTDRHISEALNRADAVTRNYITEHKRHFSHHFAQTICFLMLFALASASLLGLGGWLVIQGELSLGQLVAAELVLSVAFYGVSQLGTYLGYFYELCGAIDEIALFETIEQEEATGSVVSFEDSNLEFVKVTSQSLGSTVLDFKLPGAARVMGLTEDQRVQRAIANLLRRHERPTGGYVAVGGVDISSILPHTFRQQVMYLARPNLVEMSIREYLDLSGTQDSLTRNLEVIATVGLEAAIARLPQGLETRLSTTGWPLTISESMRLRLAAAIIARPRVLVLNQLYDVMPDEVLQRSLDLLQERSQTLVIYFTGRPRELGFTRYLHLGVHEQQVFDSLAELSLATRPDDQLPADVPA
jgi:putative ABC transport system ATP-binding protein